VNVSEQAITKHEKENSIFSNKEMSDFSCRTSQSLHNKRTYSLSFLALLLFCNVTIQHMIKTSVRFLLGNLVGRKDVTFFLGLF
jgi:hypothetical protein